MSETTKTVIAKGVMFFAITFGLSSIIVAIMTGLGHFPPGLLENIMTIGFVLAGATIVLSFIDWLDERGKNGSSK